MGADIVEQNPRQAGGESVADLRVRHAPLHGVELPTALVPT
jgi:3-phosphoshikimate 1-carboxyvinyltransferase